MTNRIPVTDSDPPHVTAISMTDEQLLMMWQLTEMSCPKGGPTIDLVASLRDALRGLVEDAKERVTACAASKNGQAVEAAKVSANAGSK